MDSGKHRKVIPLEEVWIFPEFRTYYPEKFTPKNASTPIKYIREDIHLNEIKELKEEMNRYIDEAISVIHDLKAENISLTNIK
jgi:hypothetical protein